jgi:hypothetical protein
VPSPADREEFERRLLALVRDYMDEAEDHYPEGFEVGDFMVLFEIFTRVDDSEPLEPWSGGVRSGFNSPVIAFSTTTSAYWLDEAWLVEALGRVRERRRAAGDHEDANDPDTDDG